MFSKPVVLIFCFTGLLMLNSEFAETLSSH